MWKIVLLLCVNLFSRTSSVHCVVMLFSDVLRTIAFCLLKSIRLLPVILNIWEISRIVWEVILCIYLFTRACGVHGVIMLFGYILGSISFSLLKGVTLLSIVLNIWQIAWVIWKIILCINLLTRASSIHWMIMMFSDVRRTISFSLMNCVTLLSIILHIWQVTRIIWKIIFVSNIYFSSTLNHFIIMFAMMLMMMMFLMFFIFI